MSDKKTLKLPGAEAAAAQAAAPAARAQRKRPPDPENPTGAALRQWTAAGASVSVLMASGAVLTGVVVAYERHTIHLQTAGADRVTILFKHAIESMRELSARDADDQARRPG